MQGDAHRGGGSQGQREHGEGKTVPCDHGVGRELLLIGLVVAMGLLAAAVILLPAVVTT